MKEVCFVAHEMSYTQEVQYEWFPRPCGKRDKWGHLLEECDPEKSVWKPKPKGSPVAKVTKDSRVTNHGYQVVPKRKRNWKSQALSEGVVGASPSAPV